MSDLQSSLETINRKVSPETGISKTQRDKCKGNKIKENPHRILQEGEMKANPSVSTEGKSKPWSVSKPSVVVRNHILLMENIVLCLSALTSAYHDQEC